MPWYATEAKYSTTRSIGGTLMKNTTDMIANGVDIPSANDCLLQIYEQQYELEDYQKGVPRWCTGCGDNAILTAVQRLCRDEALAPEKTVFVSGIGCSSRLPHYMNTYGVHSLHGGTSHRRRYPAGTARPESVR